MSVIPTRVSAATTNVDSFVQNRAQLDALTKLLGDRHAHVTLGGGAAMVKRHHERKKILARDRIDLLVDPLSAVSRAVAAGGVGALRQRGTERRRRPPASALIEGVPLHDHRQ